MLNGARRMAREGKKEEAAQALNDYIASNPGAEQAKEAQDVLKELDKLAAEGVQAKDSRDPRGSPAKQPGKTPSKSRPGMKPQSK